jgi:hypothetical protein
MNEVWVSPCQRACLILVAICIHAGNCTYTEDKDDWSILTRWMLLKLVECVCVDFHKTLIPTCLFFLQLIINVCQALDVPGTGRSDSHSDWEVQSKVVWKLVIKIGLWLIDELHTILIQINRLNFPIKMRYHTLFNNDTPSRRLDSAAGGRVGPLLESQLGLEGAHNIKRCI